MRQFEIYQRHPADIVARQYLVRGSQPVLVDTGFPYDQDAIIAALVDNGIPLEALGLILITHGHYDHFGSVGGLKAAAGVYVAVPASEAHCLIDGNIPPVQVLTTTGQLIRMLPSGDRPDAPIIPDGLLTSEEGLGD